MFNLKNNAKYLVLLPVISATLFAGLANAETIRTKNFSVKITRNCAEGNVTCNNVSYVGKDLKTGRSIRLNGKTIHTKGANGTPGRFLGYEFRNSQYLYRVTADNKLQVFKSGKLLLQEQGTLVD